MARWRRGDTEAFNAVTSAGEKLRTAYEKSQLGQAYREGGEVTKPEDQAQLDYYKAQGLGARQSIDENNWYTPGTPEGAAAEAQNASAARLAKSYDQSYDAGSKYRVGSQSYDQAPTPQQLHRGGLERQMAFLASRGDVEGASTLGERISGLDTAAQQRELVKGQLAMQPGQLEAQKLGLEESKGKLERHRLADDAGKEYRADLKDPLAASQRLFNSNLAGAGQGDYANQDAQYKKGTGGINTVWFTDKKTGEVVPNSLRNFTDADAKKLVTDAYFHKLSSIDPEFAFRNADRVDKTAYQTRMADLEEKKINATEKYQNATSENQRQHYANELERIGNEAKKWSALYGQKQPQQDLYKYELEQKQKFDVAKEDILSKFQAGTLTEAEADKQLRFAAVKFGSAGTSLGAAPKAVAEDPDLDAARKRWAAGHMTDDEYFTYRNRSSALGGGLDGKLGAGGTRPTATPPLAMPGRPYYDTPAAQLRVIADRKGKVSSEEQRAALAELEARKTDSRMK